MPSPALYEGSEGHSKYRAKRCQVDGETLDSQAEARRYAGLKLLERAGEISALRRQPRFPVMIEGELMFTYVADFGYLRDGKEVIEDVKGVRTPVYKLKKKIVERVYNVTIIEVK